ncbi:MAG TPA: hypothetical protein VK966_04205 [Longimicrobiales bacterium]|nr:hypothetical protein [Longimicrobiales bacterium]
MAELIPIVFMLCVAGVLILRPISKRLGLLLEAFARERMTGRPAAPLEDAQVDRITAAMERLHSRMDLLDDRVHFMERLTESGSSRKLTG